MIGCGCLVVAEEEEGVEEAEGTEVATPGNGGGRKVSVPYPCLGEEDSGKEGKEEGERDSGSSKDEEQLSSPLL